MSQEKSIYWRHIFYIVGVGIILTIPILINGCLDSQDFRYHLIYSKHFSEQFWHGEFYPRWLQKMNLGLGSPTFFFYAPIPYFFTSLFSPLFHYNTLGCNELGLSSSLALVASGITAYLWLKEIVPKNSAAIASIIYMAWPYHLVVDLYVRFAFAEYWSFVWIPLILYFSVKIVNSSKLDINVIGLAVSFALLALTHLPTFIIFLPVPITYTLFLAGKNRWKIVSVRLSLAIVMMSGLSAIYWFPALSTQESISMDAILTDAYYYGNNFLFTGPKVGGHDKFFWRYLELSTVLMGGLAFSAWKISEKSSSEANFRRELNFWTIVAMLSFFMTLPISKFVWDILPVVQRIQFSWRFNTVLTVASVGIFALAISQLKVKYDFSNKKKLFLTIIYLAAIASILTFIHLIPIQQKIVFWESRNTVLALALMAFILLGISFVQKPINFSNHKFVIISLLLTITLFLGGTSVSYKSIFINRMSDNKVSKILEVSKGADEHRPKWVPKEIFDNLDEGKFGKLGEKFPKIQVSTGQASLLIKEWQPRKIVLQVDATKDTEFTIHQFYYPGWTAKLKERSQTLPVRFSELGLLQISVPTGKHEVYVTLDPLVQERIGSIISAVSAVLTLFLFLALKTFSKESVQ